MKLRWKYELTWPFRGPVHTWSVIGPRAAMHLHIHDHGEEYGKKYGERYSGGIEMHYRSPPEYMQDQPPSHDHCHLLQCPCWHDGSILRATEYWIPMWLQSPDDHARILQAIENELIERTQPLFGQVVAAVTDGE